MSTNATEPAEQEGYWNHRVMRHRSTFDRVTTIWYEVHEVHYNGDGEITRWTELGTNARGDDLEELAEYLEWMRESLKHPVLNYDDGALLL